MRKVKISTINDAIPMVIHPGNKLNILVVVNKIDHFAIGTLDTCMITVSDHSCNVFKVQFKTNGFKLAKILKPNHILLIKVNMASVNKQDIVAIASDSQVIFRFVNPRKPFFNKLCE